jgi:RND superfamily putative drug exporter
MNRFTRRIGSASARRPWVTIVTWAVALLLVLPLAGTVGGSFVDDLVAPGSQSEEAMELLEERFPEASGGSAMAVFAAPEGELLERHRSAVDAAVARIADVEHVATVADPFTAGALSPRRTYRLRPDRVRRARDGRGPRGDRGPDRRDRARTRRRRGRRVGR